MMWKTHGEACSETNLLQWWGSTVVDFSPLQVIDWHFAKASIPQANHSTGCAFQELMKHQGYPLGIKHGLLENPRSKWISIGNSIRMWEFSRVRLPIDVTSHNGALWGTCHRL